MKLLKSQTPIRKLKEFIRLIPAFSGMIEGSWTFFRRRAKGIASRYNTRNALKKAMLLSRIVAELSRETMKCVTNQYMKKQPARMRR